MPNYGELHTKKTWQASMEELREELRKWGVRDVQLPIYEVSKKAGYVELKFVPPKTQVWKTVKCDRWKPDGWKPNWLETDLRAIVQAVQNVRMMDQRGIGDIVAQVASHLLLPSGDTVKAKRPAWQVLGCQHDAPLEVKQACYRAMVKKTHPDQGGTAEAFKEVMEAAKEYGLTD